MISVIVPVYNVKPYLEKCLDSILRQTYRDSEILIVDDGSTDGSQDICDDFEKKDNRVKVFHTENRGLSCARNLGLQHAKGDWIGFVDSDDWIEPDMYECLIRSAIDNCADISCCGYDREYSDRSASHFLTNEERCYEGDEMIASVMEGSTFGHYAWNKVYKRELFSDDCKFPPGMLFEDIATIWKLIVKCHRVVCVPNTLYHYLIRKDSIGNTKTMKNLADRWTAFKERFDKMASKSDELQRICTKRCLETIGYTWRWLYVTEKKDRVCYEERLREMRAFAKANRGMMRSCSMAARISVLCAIYSNPVSVFGCYWLNQIFRRAKGLDRMT